jgi:hypothetical protein
MGADRPTVIEDYLRRRRNLSARERAFTESLRDARFGLYEVQEVEPGHGCRVKDLYGGAAVFIHDVSISRSVAQWDCVLGRVHEFEGEMLIVGTCALIPRDVLAQFQEWVAEESGKCGQTEQGFIRANSHRLHRVAGELGRGGLENLRVVNQEGDPIEFAQANYQVLDELAVLERLRMRPEFKENPDPQEPNARQFAWMEPGPGEGGRTVYGNVAIRRGRLRLECNSRKRLTTGRRLLESAARAGLKHLGDSFESAAAAQRRMAAGKPSEPR